MYTDKKSVLQLVALLKAFGISNVVLSPGSRNIPILQTISSDPFFNCHSIVDERSAGYAALGISLANERQPVMLCCTSGTAVLNYAPAVAEAFHQRIPLIVVTADRPASRIGQMENQTIKQSDVFGSTVRCSCSLPEIQNDEDEWFCNRLINEALIASSYPWPAPVHINVPLTEPLFNCTVRTLPQPRKITLVRHNEINALTNDFLKAKRIMILIGQSNNPVISRDVADKLTDYGCVVLAESLSNTIYDSVVQLSGSMMADVEDNELKFLRPDLLITCGGHIVSKSIRRLLADYPFVQHWHIGNGAEICDTYQCLTHRIDSDAAYVLSHFAKATDKRTSRHYPEYLRLWQSKRKNDFEPSPSDFVQYAVKRFMEALPDKAMLFLANSSSVRLALEYPVPAGVKVFSNRGTSGIDGCMSTATGALRSTADDVFLLTGDLAFFYDVNSLWSLNGQTDRLHILIINDKGGGIFHTLKGFSEAGLNEKYITTPHKTSARQWASAAGLEYICSSGTENIDDSLSAFFNCPHGIILELLVQ
jgi:2-succinyl-5-enolpyruvyl-6-hydroxy-3-cyclohexene-1-carboxylate synthase